MDEFVEIVAQFHHVGIGTLLFREWLLGVKQHTRAKAHPAVVALKDVIVLTSLATFPKLIVVCQLRKGDRFVAHT